MKGIESEFAKSLYTVQHVAESRLLVILENLRGQAKRLP